MAIVDFLIIAVVVSGIVKIVSRWLKTKEVVGQRQAKELAQQMEDVQRRLSVLEEIFVTEDLGLQRKLRHTLGTDALRTAAPPPVVRPPEQP